MRTVGGREHLTLCRREAGVEKAGDHAAVELVGEDEQILNDAVRNAGEERQGAALFRAQV
jgi:hypothetical protein